MGQYNDKVERQRILLEAEEWAKGIKSIHAHSLNSMWYDTRPQDTLEDGVLDVTFNDESIKRELKNGEIVWMNGDKKTGDELIDHYVRTVSPTQTQSLLK